MNLPAVEETQKVELLNEAALKLNQAQESRQALRLLQKAIKLLPDHVPTQVVLGLVNQSLGDVQAAEEYFRRAIELDPKSKEGLQSLGLFLIAHDRKAEGAQCLEKYLELVGWQDQSNTQLLYSTLKEIDRKDEALEWLRTAWEETYNLEIGVALAKELREAGQLEEACHVFELVTSKTEDHKIFYEFGQTLRQNKQYKKAIRAFDRALDLVLDLFSESKEEYYDYFLIDDIPSNEVMSSYWYWIALCYLELKEGELALEAINETIALAYTDAPDSYDLLLKLQILDLLKKYEDLNKFAEKYDVAGDDEPVSPLADYYIIWAEALREIGRYDQAFTVINEGIKAFPNNYILYVFGLLYLKDLNKDDVRLRFLETALRNEITPQFKAVFFLQKLIILDSMGHQRLVKKNLNEFTWNEKEDTLAYLEKSVLNSVIGTDEVSAFYLGIFNHLLSIFPDRPNLQRLDTWIKLTEREWRKAYKIYKAMLEETLPDWMRQETLNNIGCACLYLGKPEEAAHYLDEAVQASPVAEQKEPNWLATVLHRGGKFDLFASATLPKIADIKDENYWDIDPSLAAKANLAALALSRGETGQAATLAGEVIAAKPQESLGYVVLGSVALARDERQTAVDLWRVGAQWARGYYRETLEKWLKEIQGSNDSIDA